MTVYGVCNAVDELAPPGLAESGDAIGLQVGRPDARVSSLLVTLSVTPDAIRAAHNVRAQMMVSHHPLIRTPLSALRDDIPHTALCLELVRAKMACYVAHTNLDVAPGGVNDTLASVLGLKGCAPLFPAAGAAQVKLVTFVPATHLASVRDAVCAAGAGVIGEYTHCTFSAPGTGTFMPGKAARPFSGVKKRLNELPECRVESVVPKAQLALVLNALIQAHPYEEVAYDILPLENRNRSVGMGVHGMLSRPMTLQSFADKVRRSLKLSHVRIIGQLKHKVSTVAVLGGSGGSHIHEVPHVDVFVTGDVRYHDAQTALERGVCAIDAGHGGTERVIVPVLANRLRERLKTVRITTYIEPEVFGVR